MPTQAKWKKVKSKGKRTNAAAVRNLPEPKQCKPELGHYMLTRRSAEKHWVWLETGKNFGRKSGRIGRGRKDRDVGKVPHIVVFYEVSGSRFQFAFRHRKVMKTVFVRVFYFFFKKGKPVDGVVVVLCFFIADLLDQDLLNAGEQQPRDIVDHQAGGSNEHQNPKRMEQVRHSAIKTQRWEDGLVNWKKLTLRKCKNSSWKMRLKKRISGLLLPFLNLVQPLVPVKNQKFLRFLRQIQTRTRNSST